MKSPYKHPFPFPKENLPGGPWAFSENQGLYPFPIPSEELFPEHEWPKSLCKFAEECKAEDIQDLDTAGECTNALHYGCPLFLTRFSEFQEFGECKSVQIFELGQTESKDYKEKDLEKIVENFGKLSKTHSPPMVVLGHGENQKLLGETGLPSAGWVTKLWTKGKKLYADFKDVPKQVVNVIKKGAYKFPSVEIYRNFVHDNQSFGPVLRRVALLGADIPRIKSLNDVVARYEELEHQDSFCLPVVRLDDNQNDSQNGSQNSSQDDGQDDSQDEKTLWLGGETMKNLSIPVKTGSKDFKVGEEIILGDETIGTLVEFDEHELVLEVDSDSEIEFSEDKEIFGKESEAKAVIGEPISNKDPEQFASFFFELEDVKGKHKIGDTLTGKDSKIQGTIKKILPKGFVIEVAAAENLFKEGETLIGADPEITARIAKFPMPFKRPYPYPSPYPTKTSSVKITKKSEGTKDFDALREEMAELIAQGKAKDAKIASLETHAEEQDEKIKKTDDERGEEKRAAHLADISRWAEELKRKGLAPAIIDEGGLMSYAVNLDSQNLVLFAEKEDKKSHWTKFSELMDSFVDAQKDGKLFVPLDDLGKVIETEEVIAEGVDADAAKLDKAITKHAEENKVSYDEAFKVVTAEKKI